MARILEQGCRLGQREFVVLTHIIHTRLQPGGQTKLAGSNRFNGFANPKPLKRLRKE